MCDDRVQGDLATSKKMNIHRKFTNLSESVRSVEKNRAPFAGISTLLDAPAREFDLDISRINDLDVGLIGVPMDLGVTNRPGARFGPRAVRSIERIGPYNHVLDCTPMMQLNVADLGDVQFSSRFLLEQSHTEIEHYFAEVVGAGVIPLAVGGDHSISQSILKAVGRHQPVGLIHIDAHCDTSEEFEQARFHHGGPFRNAVLAGVLDPHRTIQIGIRGSLEYAWEFSYQSGMTVVHTEDVQAHGIDAMISKARSVVGDGPTYVSFDIDSIDPAFAPGTGTPEVGGLTPREVQMFLRGLKGVGICGGDVVEVAPQYDSTTNTAQIAAQILFEILSLIPSSSFVRRR